MAIPATTGRERHVNPAYKAIIDDRMGPMFTWLDDFVMRIDNEHIGTGNTTGLPTLAADELARLLAIAAVPRSLHGTPGFQEAKNYARQRVVALYGPLQGGAGVPGGGPGQPQPAG